MNQIKSVDGPLVSVLPDIILTAYRTTIEWKNRSIEWISFFQTHLQQNPNHAIAIFVIANVIFFYFINNLAQRLDERVDSSPKQLTGDEKRFNQFLIDGIVVGGSSLICNIALSRLLAYPLEKSALAIAMISSIALRLFLSRLSKEE